MIHPYKLVSNLELSKKLYALGVEQEAQYSWYEITSGAVRLSKTFRDCSCGSPRRYDEYSYSAFSVGELGEMIPASITVDGFELTQFSFKSVFWDFGYGESLIFNELTEADTRARALIYLLENKIVDLESVNFILERG